MDRYLARGKHTDTLRHDGHLIGALVPAPDAVLTEETLASVQTPTFSIWGDDSFGDKDDARLLSGLGHPLTCW